jgi:hypothetical protein
MRSQCSTDVRLDRRTQCDTRQLIANTKSDYQLLHTSTIFAIAAARTFKQFVDQLSILVEHTLANIQLADNQRLQQTYAMHAVC